MHFMKSYGQKKFMSDFMAISFVFWPDISECLKEPDWPAFLFGIYPYIV